MVLAGHVTTVSLRQAYTRALKHVPGAHVPERNLLQRFGSGKLRDAPRHRVQEALRLIGVDLACVQLADRRARSIVAGAGYGQVLTTASLACFRPR